MSPDIVHHIASSFLGFKGFRIVPYTHRLGVVTHDGKRHVFVEEADFWKFAGDLTAQIIKEK